MKLAFSEYKQAAATASYRLSSPLLTVILLLGLFAFSADAQTPVPCPPGIVACWEAEGNGLDSVGTNNASLLNSITYGAGEVGQAFVLNGTSSYVRIPASQSLDVGKGSGFTIEAWVNPANLGIRPIFEWNNNSGNSGIGVHFWISTETTGDLHANIIDTSVNNHSLAAASGTMTANEFQHVAVTYDKASGVAVLYRNGVAVKTANLGTFTPQTSFNAYIGLRPSGSFSGLYYQGKNDETSLYNRALTAAELQAIYIAGSAGKALAQQIAPSITTQPAGQSVTVGNTATFSVVANGRPAPIYQWQLGGHPISGATNSSLVLTNVQSGQAGLYSAVVSNTAGFVVSSNALLTVLPTPLPTPIVPGLVAWWRAEGNGLDSVGANNANLLNSITYGAGEVGQAFVLDGSSSYVRIPASPSMDVGQGNGLTIEAWVNPANYAVVRSIFEWNNNAGNSGIGAHFQLSCVTSGDLYANIIDTSVNNHTIASPAGTITTNEFQHVAVTYDKASGIACLYRNGLQVATANLGSFTPQTSFNVYLGYRPSGSFSDLYLQGSVDEPSLYNRALSATEIQAICNAGAAGKTLTAVAPSIASQPASQTVTAGTTATFSVIASGQPAPAYQWRLGGNPISGATSSSLVLSNIQPSQAGLYSVLISNVAGVLISSNALLTVLPVSILPPSGLVSWWRAEGNGLDSVGTNNANLLNAIAYGAGEVGQAFVLNGTGSYIRIPASPSLDVGKSGGFTIEAWVNPATLGNRPIFEWNNSSGNSGIGAHFWMSSETTGDLQANIIDTSVNNHSLAAASGTMTANEFQHVALTYDKASGIAVLYRNGVAVKTANLGTFTPQTSFNAYIGLRPSGSFSGLYWQGKNDETSLYGRALSSAEIRAIYNASTAGKALTPVAPTITFQPAGQTVTAGDTATFSVVASAQPAPVYQWRLGGNPISGATNSSLVLSNVQSGQAGFYSVLVSNTAGFVVSSNALLTVLPAPVCISALPGLISWWRAESNGLDSVGTNNANVLNAITYSAGEVGQAFVLNGTSSYIRIPASPSLDVGKSGGFTIEAWVNPATLGNRPIFEWNNSSGNSGIGVHFWMSSETTGDLHANIIDTSVNNHSLAAASGTMTTNGFQHVAVTYDKASGIAVLYRNGVAVKTANLGTFTPQTSFNAYIGLRPSGSFSGLYWQGKNDETSLYSRALTASEIQANYFASRAGKCTEAPWVATQPAGQLVQLNSDATLSVVAGGTPNLCFQWRFNGTNIAGANASALTITNAQLANVGLYSVSITNAFGAVTSSNALLSINRPPVAQALSALVVAGAGCLAPGSVDNGSFDPDGDFITLAQTPPGPYPLGTNLVTLTVLDYRGGSNSATALVIVVDQTPPTLTCPANIVVTNTHDSATSVVAYSPSAWDNCSGSCTPVCTPPSGTAFGIGVHTVNVTASDASGNQARGSFTVTILSGNTPPVPVIQVAPLAKFPNRTNLLVIAPCGLKALVYFDASKSYDLDDTGFLYSWSEGTNVFSTCVVATNTLRHGTHTITLQLDDTHPGGVSRASVDVSVISPAEAVDIIIDLLQSSGLPQKRQHPLLATLNAARRSFEDDRILPGAAQLYAFRFQVRAQVEPQNQALADALIQAADQILKVLTYRHSEGGREFTFHWAKRGDDGRFRMKFDGPATQVHLVQASSDLQDWQTIGIAQDNGDGTFDFDDPAAGRIPRRFYRIVMP